MYSSRVRRVFLMLASAILASFLYVSYRKNTTFLLSSHLHDGEASIKLAEALRRHQTDINTKSIHHGDTNRSNSTRAIPNHSPKYPLALQQQQQQQQQDLHREVNEDAPADEGSGESGSDDAADDEEETLRFVNNNSLAEQYRQNVDNAVVPSTSVLPQKQDPEQKQPSKADTKDNVENNNADNDIEPNDEALTPSEIVRTKKENNSINAGNEDRRPPELQKPIENRAKSKDERRKHGLLTENIYEMGHLNDEIDIAQICPNDGVDIKLFALITSAPPHEEARSAIRKTWGHFRMRRDVSIAFLLGRTLNESLNLALEQENFIYGDLIRGNSIDSYNNLTLKTVSMLKWVDTHCRHVKYVLKTDDDMFINVPKLLDFLSSHSEEERVIYGFLAEKSKPFRNNASKYYLSTEDFPGIVFPPFTAGPAYVLSSDTIHDLYENALKEVYLKLEDVFMTGIVAAQLDIKRVNVTDFLSSHIDFNPCKIRKYISYHNVKASEQFDLWKGSLDQKAICE